MSNPKELWEQVQELATGIRHRSHWRVGPNLARCNMEEVKLTKNMGSWHGPPSELINCRECLRKSLTDDGIDKDVRRLCAVWGYEQP